MYKRIFAAAASLSFLLATGYNAAASEQFDLKFQSTYASNQIQTTQVLNPWTEKVKELSGGSIVINTFPMNAIVKIDEAHHALQEGLIDLTIMGSPAPKEAPYMFMAALPGAVKGPRHGSLYSKKLYETVPEFKNEIDRYGVPFGFYSPANTVIVSVNTPIRSLADLKGKRVLVPLAADSKMIEAWGGIPVMITPPDAYVGLQRGMGECMFTPIPMVKMMRLMEVVKYATRVPGRVGTMVFAVNRDLLEKEFDDSQREAFWKASEGLGLKLADTLESDTTDVLEMCKKDYGVEIIDLSADQYKEFSDRNMALVDSYYKPMLKELGISGDVDEWIKKIYEISDSIVDNK